MNLSQKVSAKQLDFLREAARSGVIVEFHYHETRKTIRSLWYAVREKDDEVLTILTPRAGNKLVEAGLLQFLREKPTCAGMTIRYYAATPVAANVVERAVSR